MNKTAIPLNGAALLLALGAALSSADHTPALLHAATALEAAAGPVAGAESSNATRRADAAPGRAPFLLSPFGHVPPPRPSHCLQTRPCAPATWLRPRDRSIG